MAIISLNIPDAVVQDLEAALRERFAGRATGRTRREVFALWFVEEIKPMLQAYRRRQGIAPLVATELSARVALETALKTEVTARLAAEKAVDTNLNTDLAGIN